MKLRVVRFLHAFVRNAGPLAPVLVVAALVSVFLAAEATRRFVAQHAAQASEVRAHTVQLRRDPITATQALQAAQQLSRLVPGVQVQVAGTDVVVSVQDKEHVAEWLYALSVVQTTLPQVAWEPRQVCLVACEGGAAARAYVTAFRPRLVASH